MYTSESVMDVDVDGRNCSVSNMYRIGTRSPPKDSEGDPLDRDIVPNLRPMPLFPIPVIESFVSFDMKLIARYL